MHSHLQALLGGARIGLAAATLLLFSGRIAGISGISGRRLRLDAGPGAWRAAFIGGLPHGGGGADGVLHAARLLKRLTMQAFAALIAGLLFGAGLMLAGQGLADGLIFVVAPGIGLALVSLQSKTSKSNP